MSAPRTIERSKIKSWFARLRARQNHRHRAIWANQLEVTWIFGCAIRSHHVPSFHPGSPTTEPGGGSRVSKDIQRQLGHYLLALMLLVIIHPTACSAGSSRLLSASARLQNANIQRRPNMRVAEPPISATRARKSFRLMPHHKSKAAIQI